MDVRAFRRQIILLPLLFFTHCSTGRTIHRICKGTIDILTTVGVRIEPHPKSYVKMALFNEPLFSNTSKFRLGFEFNTNSADGILFYGRTRNPDELIALFLKDGDLMYKIRCPTFHADILVPVQNNSLFNDSTWHTISYSIEYARNSRPARIKIDGHSNSRVARYLISCANLTTIIMGGHREQDNGYIYDLENLPGHFEGCIRNCRDPIAHRHPPQYSFVSICG